MRALSAEAQRRLSVLVILAVLSAAWASVLGAKGVPSLAPAVAAPSTPAPQACPFPTGMRTAFIAASKDAALPPSLLYAVAEVESGIRQNAMSSAGAVGVLQVMPATARSLALDPSEARTNVLAGARYLRQMLDEFGTVDLALAAYNAGPTAVARAGGAPSSGVLTYVANVDQIWHAHAGCS